MSSISTVLSDGDIFLRSWIVSLTSAPSTNDLTTLSISSLLIARLSPSSVSTVPSAPTVASDAAAVVVSATKLPLNNFSFISPPNFSKFLSYSNLRSSASFIAILSTSRLCSNLASSNATLRSLSLCFLTDPNAHCKDLSHFSLKSTSIPLLNNARIKSAPASSYTSALRISSARFHNFPAEHGRLFLVLPSPPPVPQWVISVGGVYSLLFVVLNASCNSRATFSTVEMGTISLL
mmetsp:Transcript_11850/g.19385  ORF Transcript_11850/g.19385 Transcript_11850/m.19385 type:complete len:235 (-) Transcript_11850:198-902(-)